MKPYTIEQIRKYLLSQDSMGDILHNLSEANIDKANEVVELEEGEMYILNDRLSVFKLGSHCSKMVTLRPGDDVVYKGEDYDNFDGAMVLFTIDDSEDLWFCDELDFLNAIKD